MKNKIKKYSFFLAGLLIIALGVNLAFLSNLGLAPWDAINFALSNKFNVSTGICINVVSIFLLIAISIFTKKKIKLTCFITASILGFAIDFWTFVLGSLTIENIAIRLLVFMIGLVFISLGLSIYLSTNLPQNTIDYAMVELKEKFNLKTVKAKLIVDVTCIIIAIIFQGPIGLGTILLTFGAAPLTGFFEKKLSKILVYK